MPSAFCYRSDRVRSRTARLIEQVELPQVRERSSALHESAVTGEGTYKTFLQRWGYDANNGRLSVRGTRSGDS
jgi:hypothetical protein